MRSTRPLLSCWLLLSAALLCLPPAHSLLFRFYNDSSCTLPLPQYSLDAPALNYTTPFGDTPFLRSCAAWPGTAGLYLNYSCSVSGADTSLAYLNAYAVNSSDCTVDPDRTLQYIINTQGYVNATASSCVSLSVYDYASTPRQRVRGYGYWSCAAQSNSNSAPVAAASTQGLVLALSAVIALALLFAPTL